MLKKCPICNVKLTDKKSYVSCDNSECNNKRSYAKKVTKAEKGERVSIVVEMLLSCAPRRVIIEYSRINWGIERAMTDRYIHDANEIIDTKIIEDIDKATAKAIRRRRQIAFKAEQKGDIQTALRALDSIDRIKGVLKNVIAHEGEITSNSKVTVYVPDNKRKLEVKE